MARGRSGHGSGHVGAEMIFEGDMSFSARLTFGATLTVPKIPADCGLVFDRVDINFPTQEELKAFCVAGLALIGESALEEADATHLFDWPLELIVDYKHNFALISAGVVAIKLSIPELREVGTTGLHLLGLVDGSKEVAQ